jgi:hypothetical protein
VGLLRQLLDPLGLGSAFTFAVATYWVFMHLDRIASQDANRSINEWISGTRTIAFDARTAIFRVFDELYTYPLLRPRAFFRSARISAIYSAAFIIGSLSFILALPGLPRFKAEMLLLIFAADLVSDYISLFVVRKWLTIVGLRPVLALGLAPLIGGFVIFVCYTIAYSIHFAIWTDGGVFPVFLYDWLTGSHESPPPLVEVEIRLRRVILLFYGVYAAFMIPATFVYLWLPFMLLGIWGLRLFHLLIAAVSRTQWFIRQGSQHPYRAIGLVAACLVFVSGMILQVSR